MTYAVFHVLNPSTPLTVLTPIEDRELAAYQQNTELLSIIELQLSTEFRHAVEFQMFIKSRTLTLVQMLAASEVN